jgi:Rrf2 family protein
MRERAIPPTLSTQGQRWSIRGAILRSMRLELTRRGDYAVRAMLALASETAAGPLSARRIAERMEIPPRFLPQVMSDLAAAGLVEATTGRSGGYRLSRPPARISLLEVIEAVEGDSRRQTCALRGGPCGADGTCAIHDVFSAAQDALLRQFAGASLEDMAGRRTGGGPRAATRRDG